MLSSVSPQQSLQNFQINNESNHGIIGNGSNNIVTSGDNNQFIFATAEEDELDRLLGPHVSNDALRNSFRSPPECHPNTRTTIINDIGGWLEESTSKNSPLLWLNGPAAVGKSVIAKTVSGFHNQIVGTFFFSTSSDKSAATLFPTLAWQLARRIPDTRNHILASLKSSDSLQTCQIEEQFDRLIIQPLNSITALGSRPVMLIDGVDECTDGNMLVRFLRVLVHAGEGGDMPVRFIICSRPEPRIHAILGGDHDVNPYPTKDGPEPQLPIHLKDYFVGYLTWSILGMATVIPGLGLLRLIRMFGTRQLVQNTRKYGIFHLFRLLRRYGSSEVNEFYSKIFGFFGPLIGTAVGFGFVLWTLARPRYEAHLATPIQRNQDFLQDVWELYRPIRLDVNKGATFPTSDRLADTFDKICPYPVISIIQIGFSRECKDDMMKYLADKFNAIRQPGGGTSLLFQPSDFSDIVETSCGQFLYASTIVRLLDDSSYSPRNVFEMARCSSLPTPDLDELYKAILKRAQEGSPDYRFVKDSLAILVFFAGNIQFLTVRKNFPVIEVLLGLEKGKLNKKLCKMHSVLSIVPGESIGVYHRSFFEFLLDHKRSGEYHISYSNGLRRILCLMIRAWFRYNLMRWQSGSANLSRDEDDKRLGLVHGMSTACRHNFYRRSRFSSILFYFHAFIHLLICSQLFLFLFHLQNYLPFSFSIFIAFLSPLGGFIISLTAYTFFLNRSIIFPFFHPFLHPLFVSTAGFLSISSMLLVYVLVIIIEFIYFSI